MIPRVFHRIWLGEEPMPEEFVAYGETWRRHHPDWTMELWTEERLPALRHPDAFERGRNHSERSNVLRYELLWQLGGVYIDTDMECLRPIDPLLDSVCAFAGSTRPGRIGSAIVGSVPGHPAFERAVELVPQGVAGGGRQTEETGPGFLTAILADFPDVTVFPAAYFYPYRHDEKHLRGQEFPDAYAVHHWTKTWESYDELRARVERLQRKLGRREARLEEVKRARDRAVSRRKAIEGSRWWRLGGAAAAAARAVRRRSGRA
ncbi:MAG: glycosyltransferase [Thermoleophilaceae bacterium]